MLASGGAPAQELALGREIVSVGEAPWAVLYRGVATPPCPATPTVWRSLFRRRANPTL